MPTFRLTVTLRQTLADTEVVEIDAPDLATAIERAARHAGSDDESHVPEGMNLDTARTLARMDPHEVIDGETDITPGDAYGGSHLEVDDNGMEYWVTPGCLPSGEVLNPGAGA